MTTPAAWSAALATALTLAPAGAQAEVVTLSWVRSRALAEHPELAASAARVDAAEASVEQAKSATRPRIGADLAASVAPGGQIFELESNGQTFRVPATPVLGDDDAVLPIPRWRTTVGLDWRIYDFGKSSAATRSARWKARARQARAAATADALVEAVDAAYLDWLDASERAELRASGLERARDRLARLEAKLDAGAVSSSSLWPARADVASRELALAEAEQVRAEAALALEASSGVDLSPTARPDAGLLAVGRASSQGSGGTDPQIEALGAQAASSEAEAERYEQAWRPELSGNAEVGFRGQDGFAIPLYAVGLGLSIPIWRGGENAAKADAARAEARALLAEKADAEAEAERERDRQELALQQARRRVELAQRLLDVAEARLRDVQSRPAGSTAHADELDRARAQRDEALEAVLGAKIDRTFAALRLGLTTKE